jgi:hypothetical protein
MEIFGEIGGYLVPITAATQHLVAREARDRRKNHIHASVTAISSSQVNTAALPMISQKFL